VLRHEAALHAQPEEVELRIVGDESEDNKKVKRVLEFEPRDGYVSKLI
jgi:hypothetical protein